MSTTSLPTHLYLWIAKANFARFVTCLLTRLISLLTSIRLSVSPTVCLMWPLGVPGDAPLSVCLSACLSVCLSVCAHNSARVARGDCGVWIESIARGGEWRRKEGRKE